MLNFPGLQGPDDVRGAGSPVPGLLEGVERSVASPVRLVHHSPPLYLSLQPQTPGAGTRWRTGRMGGLGGDGDWKDGSIGGPTTQAQRDIAHCDSNEPGSCVPQRWLR